MIQLIVQIPPPHHGAALMNEYLIDALSRSDIQFEVVSIEAATELSDIGRFSFGKIGNALRIASRIVRSRHETKAIYLVMSTGLIAIARDTLFVILARCLGKRRILHLRSKGFSNMSGLRRWLAYQAFKGAYIIQHTPLLAADVAGMPHTKSFYIANGWRDTYGSFQDQVDRNTKHPVSILFFSNLMEEKGLFVALDAIGLLADSKSTAAFKVHFLGAWENENTRIAFYQRVVQLGIENYLGEIGPRYDDAKYLALATMDFMIFPTYYRNETFGNVNLESMMFKLPVISTFEGGIPDVVEDGVTGFLVPQRDAAALAEKMALLIDDPLLRRSMGDAGRNRFLSYFTIDKFEARMIDAFNEILTSSQSIEGGS